MNKELKEKFYEEKSSHSNIGQIKGLFKKLESKEEKYGKDLCMFSIGEIIEAYKSLEFRSFDTLSNFHSVMIAYGNFCLETRVKGCKTNNYELLHTVDLRAMIEGVDANRILTREEVLDMAKKLPNPSDSFVLLCLFEGLRGRDYSEIRELKWEDFNGNNINIVPGRILDLYKKDKFKGHEKSNLVEIPEPRTIKVSDELINYARLSLAKNSYKPLTPSNDITTELVNEGYIIKRTERAVTYNIQPKLTRRIVLMFKYLGKDCSATDIRNSGKVDFVKERCKELKISAKEFVYGDHYKELLDKFNDSAQRETFWNKYNSKLVKESV